MEYELIGKDGKTHDCFGAREEAINALREEEDVRPGMTAGWMLQLYDDDGKEVGDPEWAEDLLATPVVPESGVQFVIEAEGLGLFVPVSRGASSGMATPIRRGFRRPPSDAIRTHVLSEA